MSLSQRTRGDFIREKMGLAILHDLGESKIDSKQAGDIDNLMRDLEASGATVNIELAQNEYYLKAIEAWRKHLETKREERRNK